MKAIKKRFVWNHPQKLLLYPTLRKIAPFTMLPFDALSQVQDAIRAVDRERVPGSVVEMGCWKGGCGAFMSWCTKKSGSDREVWLFDSFEGIPELSAEDAQWAAHSKLKMKDAADKAIRPAGYYLASVSDAHEALKRLGAEAKTHVEKGWFQDALPPVKAQIGAIAVLRLDGDIYESTKYCLDELYDQVSPGGWIIIDDYGLEGCRTAMYEFFSRRGISPCIINAPHDGRAYFVKR